MTRLIRKMLILLAILAIIAMFMPSCSSTNSNFYDEVIKVMIGDGTIEITDSIGRVTTLEGTPERLVSVSPGNTEMLFALGLGDKVVGITQYCNYPADEVEDKPKIGGFSTVDIEKVIAQEPDLVLAARKHTENGTIDELERHGINVIALIPETAEEVIHVIKKIGQIAGVESKAEELVQDMQTKLDAVNDLVKDLSDDERPTVFYVLRPEPLQTVGYDTLQSYIIELAGGNNIFDDLSEYPSTDFEVLLERNPQIIIANTKHGSGGQAALEWAQSEERIDEISARENNRIFGIDADTVSRPGPRIVDAVEEMFRIIHPDLAEGL